MAYSFAAESDIRRIIRSVLATERELLNRPTRTGGVHMPGAVQSYVGRVSGGDIAAINVATPGKGTITIYRIVNDVLVITSPVITQDGYNYSSAVIDNNAWATITRDPFTGSWVIARTEGNSGKVKVSDTDPLDYLEDQFSGVDTNDTRNASHLMSLDCEIYSSSVDSAGAELLYVYVPFESITGWSPDGNQILWNDPNNGGTLKWNDPPSGGDDVYAKVSSSDTTGYLEDQFEGKGETFAAATDVVVHCASDGALISPFTAMDSVSGWSVGKSQHLMNESGTIAWVDYDTVINTDEKVKVRTGDASAYLEDQFGSVETSSTYSASTDLYIDIYSSGTLLYPYVPFDDIPGWTPGAKQILTKSTGNAIAWETVGTLAAVTKVDFIDPNFVEYKTTIEGLNVGSQTGPVTWTPGSDCL